LVSNELHQAIVKAHLVTMSPPEHTLAMEVIARFFTETWYVVADMAPYLLLGFLAAGVLHVFITPAFVRRHLGKKGFSQVIKATIFGIPIPLCSCGVIPVAASLHKAGAGKGATAAFLASTPQTGADSILVTYALMGPLFTWFRVFASALTGIASGLSMDLLTSEDTEDKQGESCDEVIKVHSSIRQKFTTIIHHGFITLPSDIGGAVLLGLVISGALGAVVPHNFFADIIGQGFLGLLVMLIIGIPVYVCSTASIPIALSLIASGISPGGALVFLISGPATNAATFTTLWTILGRKATFIYLSVLAVCALSSGLLLDTMLSADAVMAFAPQHDHPPTLTEQILAALLLALLLGGYAGWLGKKHRLLSPPERK